jgi:hypothetical protein
MLMFVMCGRAGVRLAVHKDRYNCGKCFMTVRGSYVRMHSLTDQYPAQPDNS